MTLGKGKDHANHKEGGAGGAGGAGHQVGEQPMPDKSQLQRFVQNEEGDLHLEGQTDPSKYSAKGPGLFSKATLTDDGKIDLWVDLKSSLPDLHKDYARPVQELGTESPSEKRAIPPLNIVIFIVGSRGDVQPYLSLALHLVQNHGHRVRIATHPDFKDFVLSANDRLKGVKGPDGGEVQGNIEFFDVGGNPKELMSYMVKNPGLLPGWASLTNGDVHGKRKMTWQMLQGFSLSVFSPDTETGKPFAADAIISNPPAFAHCHVAEAFGIPLHMTFTMPWSPSTAFAHPLVNIKSSNAKAGLTNVLSFSFADIMTWQGLGDIINAFRGMTLGLEPLSIRMGASVLDRIKAPWTYCWSDSLIPKPEDWKEHIDISGFYFLEGDTDFKPDAKLHDFLSSGDPPIYIGFGSVVVQDPAAMTQTLFDAVKEAGVRALISAGWGGLGGTEVPDNVFILEGNIPHDWLFADGRVSAVCHHGGAGTTAIGLRNGLPTIVVPFFGDQLFWGEMIHRAGAGPEPIPRKQLSVENLSAAIRFATSDEAKAAAEKMGEKIRSERGEEKGAESFHRHLPLQSMRCDLQPEKAAGWWYPDQFLRLSGGAAAVLDQAGLLKFKDLECLRAKEYQPRWKTNDPTEGGAADLLLAVLSHYSGLATILTAPKKGTAAFAATMPQGIVDLIHGLHLAADAIPAKLGSDVRPKGKVDGFVSGVREGGKGLWYGWWDGITGLVTEPVKGGQKEGPIGVLKGMGRSYVNVTARPMAGITGVVALPLHGAYQTFRKKIAGQPQQLIREPREKLAQMESDLLSPQEKEQIKTFFREAEGKVDERRGWYKRQAELFLLDMEKSRKERGGGEDEGDGEGGEEGAEEGEGVTKNATEAVGQDHAGGEGEGEVEAYIQQGNLKMLSEEERAKMEEGERRGYEAAKAAEK